MPFDLPEIGAVFPLIPTGTSEPLAFILCEWRDARRWAECEPDDDERTKACSRIDEIEAKIASWPAASFSDIAAKLAIAAYTLKGDGTGQRSGITGDGNLLIRDAAEWNASSEGLFIEAARDALRLAGACCYSDEEQNSDDR